MRRLTKEGQRGFTPEEVAEKMKVSSILTILFLFAGLLTPISFAEDVLYVKTVVDGCTVALDNGERVKLIGLNVPQKSDASTLRQAFADETQKHLKQLTLGKRVWLEYDVRRKDGKGNTLAYLYRKADGLLINGEMIKNGYASVMLQTPFKRQAEFKEYERQARQGRKGVWGLTE